MICPHCQKDTEAADINDVSIYTWFEQFWQLYPRHVGKQAALKAWKKAATSEAVKDEIMAGLRANLEGLRARDKKYVPYPATWLNGLHWEDEPEQVSRSARVIACDRCADTGLAMITVEWDDSVHFTRCSCPRGQLPGLYSP